MMLTTPQLTRGLISRGFLSTQSIVEGDLLIGETSRRNRNFRVVVVDRDGYFVKQANPFEPSTISTIHREANFHAVLRNRTESPSLARLTPALVEYDAASSMLTLEYLSDFDTLNECHLHHRGFSTKVALATGHALATYHNETADLPFQTTDNTLLPRQLPWVFQISMTGVLPRSLGPAGVLLSSLLATCPNLSRDIASLAYAWRVDGMIHGDMKWDNILVRGFENDDLELRIVDWELVDLGDTGWDVASIIAAYISFVMWERELQYENPNFPQEQLESVIEEIQGPLHSFWDTYTQIRGISSYDVLPCLERCLILTAARLVQLAYEVLFNSEIRIATANIMIRFAYDLMQATPRFARMCMMSN